MASRIQKNTAVRYGNDMNTFQNRNHKRHYAVD